MDNNITALQNLYVALGGSLTDTYEDIANGVPVSDYTIKPDIINAIAQQLTEALTEIEAAELPTVTSDDNGKVLKVVDGAWALGTDLTE